MLSRILKKRRAVNLQSREYKLLPPVQRTIGQFLLIVKLNTLLMHIPVLSMCLFYFLTCA